MHLYLWIVIVFLLLITLFVGINGLNVNKEEGLEMKTDDININGSLYTKDMTQGDVPSGWKGGVRTMDLYAGGNIGVGTNKNKAMAWMNATGDGYFENELTVGSEIVNRDELVKGNSTVTGSSTVGSSVVRGNETVTGSSTVGSSTVTGSSTVGNETVTGNSTVRGSLDVAGNLNLTATDKLKVNGQNALPPVGSMMAFLGNTEPEGWVLCNGQGRPNDPKYAALINLGIGSVVGTNYVPPDLTNRFLKGQDPNAENKSGDLKKNGAPPTLTLTQAQMPAHNHTGTTGGMTRSNPHNHTTTAEGGMYAAERKNQDGAQFRCTHYTNNTDWGQHGGQQLNIMARDHLQLNGKATSSTDINHEHPFTTSTNGSGAVINLPPPLSYGVNYIVKY